MAFSRCLDCGGEKSPSSGERCKECYDVMVAAIKVQKIAEAEIKKNRARVIRKCIPVRVEIEAYHRLKRYAAQQNLSLAAVCRECLEFLVDPECWPEEKEK